MAQHRAMAELEAASLPLYLPDFGDGIEFAYVADGQPVVVHRHGTSGSGVVVQVVEIDAGEDDACRVLSDVSYFDSTHDACRPEHGGFTARGEYETAVGVVRGETLLVHPDDGVSPEELRATLEDAPRISARELARK